MALDLGGIGILAGGILTPAAVAYIGGKFADRSAQRAARIEEKKANDSHSTDTFAQNIELNKYIDERIRVATLDLRQELGEVKRLVGSLHGKLLRTREAVRDYIRDVRAQWGKSEQPPPLDDHLLELLGEDGIEDTYTADQIRKIVATKPTSDPTS